MPHASTTLSSLEKDASRLSRDASACALLCFPLPGLPSGVKLFCGCVRSVRRARASYCTLRALASFPTHPLAQRRRDLRSRADISARHPNGYNRMLGEQSMLLGSVRK
jgi:hypothetical protein